MPIRRSRHVVRQPLALQHLDERIVPATLSFQQGDGNGYTGTQDVQLFSAAPTVNLGSEPSLSIDQQDLGGERTALLRFDSIFGPGSNQIPLGSTINAATLTLFPTNGTDQNTTVGFYRLNVPWGQATSTFATLGSGVQTDGTDARAAYDAKLTAPLAENFTVTIGDLAPALQAWSLGAANYGWAVVSDSSNGWDFDSSESADATNRPQLTVDFTAPSGAGSISFADATTTVTESKPSVTLVVHRVGGSDGSVSASYVTVAGTAAAGSDFTAKTGTVTFAPGQTSAAITVSLLDDTAIEGAEQFGVVLTGAAVGGTATATVTVADQDLLLNEISVNPPTTVDQPYEFLEVRGAASATLPAGLYAVAINGTKSAAGKVDFVQPLTGKLGTNGLLVVKAATGGFTAATGSATLGSAQLNVGGTGLLNDAVTYAVVSSPTALAAGDDLDADDDGVLELPAGAIILDSVGWVTSGNGNSNNQKLYTPTKITQATGEPDVAARFSTDDDPDTKAAWYASDILDVGAGNASKLFTGGANASGNVPGGALLSPGGTNNTSTIQFPTAGVTVAEGAGTVTIAVTRPGDASGAATVSYTTSAGTATAGADYTTTTGTVVFAAGASTGSITVPLLNDATAEAEETFTVGLSNPVGATTNLGGQATFTVTIADDDAQAASFQQGAGGYAGTRDGGIAGGFSTVGFGAEAVITATAEDVTTGAAPLNAPRQGLLRFDNLFGSGPGQIPFGSTIFGANLTLNVEAPVTAGGATVTLNRLLVPWADTATWASFTDGVLRNNLEAATVADATVPTPNTVGSKSVAIPTGIVQAWANGGANYGWAIVAAGGSTGTFNVTSSEGATVSQRPRLSISYLPPSGTGTVSFSSATTSAVEGAGTVALTINRVGGVTGAATASYAVTGGTATAGSDYTLAAGTVSFAAGEYAKAITVTLTNDATHEANETVQVTLTGAAVGGTASTTLTVRDDDALAGVLLNELDINPPGTDQPNEYVEIAGPAGASLSGYYFVSVEGDGTAAGTADIVVDLSNVSLGSGGLLVIKSNNGGFTVPAGATTIGLANLDTGATQTLENGANSFLLVYSPNAALAAGDDLDFANDGVFRLTAGGVIADSVSSLDAGAGTLYGGAAVQTNKTGPVEAAYRVVGNTTPNSAAAWAGGSVPNDGTNGGLSKAFSPSTLIAGTPAGAVLTPGATNFAPVLAKIESVAVNDGAAQRSFVTKLTVTFDNTVTANGTLDAAFTLTPQGGGTALTPSITLTTVSGKSVATLTFPGLPGQSLADGRYTLTVVGDQLTGPGGLLVDADGNGTAGGSKATAVSRYLADADGDEAVDGNDLAALAQAFNSVVGDSNYRAYLDFDGDGAVDGNDLAVIAQRFNTVL